MVDSLHKQREELAARLQALDAVFERQMRARGFNPEQADNVALTSELASLYAAREAARAELEELSQKLMRKDEMVCDRNRENSGSTKARI